MALNLNLPKKRTRKVEKRTNEDFGLRLKEPNIIDNNSIDHDTGHDTGHDTANFHDKKEINDKKFSLENSSLVRRKILKTIKKEPANYPASKLKRFRELKNREACFEYLAEIFGSKRVIVSFLFKTLLHDDLTPRMSLDEGAKECGLKKNTFGRTIDRLVSDVVVFKYGFKTRKGGAVYWFHPNVLSCLRTMEKEDLNYFDN